MADQTDYIRKVQVEEHVANSAAKFHADEITRTHDDDALKFDKFSWHDFELIEPDEINRDQFFDDLLMFTGIFRCLFAEDRLQQIMSMMTSPGPHKSVLTLSRPGQ